MRHNKILKSKAIKLRNLDDNMIKDKVMKNLDDWRWPKSIKCLMNAMDFLKLERLGWF